MGNFFYSVCELTLKGHQAPGWAWKRSRWWWGGWSRASSTCFQPHHWSKNTQKHSKILQKHWLLDSFCEMKSVKSTRRSMRKSTTPHQWCHLNKSVIAPCDFHQQFLRNTPPRTAAHKPELEQNKQIISKLSSNYSKNMTYSSLLPPFKLHV